MALLALTWLLASGCKPGVADTSDLPAAAVRCFTSTHEIRTLALGADGAVWAGGPGGLLRFRPETESWELFTVTDGLPDNRVQAILITSRGTVWVGTLGGAARLEGATFRAWGLEEGFPSPAVTSLAEGADGTIWAGTLLGIARFTGSRWEAVTDSHEFARKAVRGIARGKDGSLWFAKENGLTRYRGERTWEIYQHNVLDPDRRMGLVTNKLLSLAADEKGALWIGTKLGLQRYNGSDWSHERHDGYLAGGRGLEDNWVEQVAALPDGTVWVAHGESRAAFGGSGAAFRTSMGRWRYLTVADGLPSNQVHAVAAGPGGDVWLGTSEGLARWDGQRVSCWRPPEALPGNHVLALIPAGDGRSQALLPAGTVSLEGGEVRSAEMAPDSGFVAAVFSDGLLYLAPAAGGLLVRRADDTRSLEKAFAGRKILSLGGSPTGPILAVTSEGIWSGSAGRWSPLPLDGIPSQVRPLQALCDAAGDLWLAGEIPSPAGGRLVIYHMLGNRCTPVPVPELPAGLPRRARLALDGSGSMLLSAPAGLYRYDGGWRAVPIPVAGGNLGAATGKRGSYWVAGRDGGLWHHEARGWREVRIGGRAAPANITAIGSSDENTLWLGTAGQGLLRLDVRQVGLAR